MNPMVTARGSITGRDAPGWLIILLSAMLVIAAGASARGTDPLRVIRAFQDAINSGNVDAAVTRFAHDAVVSNTLGRRFVSTAKIRGLIQKNVDAGIHLVPEDLHAVGDRVTWKVSESNSVYQRLGLRVVEMTTSVIVQSGRIKSWTTYFPLDTLARIEQGCTAPQAADVRLYDLPCADFILRARAHTKAVLSTP